MSETTADPSARVAVGLLVSSVKTRGRKWSFLALWAPIILLEAYLLATVMIFFFGPVDWDIPNVPKLVAFLFVNYLGLLLGYRWGIRRGRRIFLIGKRVGIGVLVVSPFILKLITFSMWFAIFGNTMRLVALRGGFGEVLATIVNPGEAYIQNQLIAQSYREGVEVASVQIFSLVFRITTVFAVFLNLYFQLAILCWQQMSWSLRTLFYAALGVTILFSLGIGAQSGIGFLLFTLMPVILYKMYVARKSGADSQNAMTEAQLAAKSKARTRRNAMLATCGLTIVVSTVVFYQLDRAETSGVNLNSGNLLVGRFGQPSQNRSLVFQNERIGFGIDMLLKYVSHGYEGLALSMELPFEWTYGLGWSKALQVILHEYMGGPDVFQSSYLVRNEKQNGWPALAWWSTIFPWIASDTTFFGTVFFMIAVGYIMGRYWMKVAIDGNPMGLAVVAQMFLLVFMIPANNAVAQTLDGLFALIGIFVLHGISERYQKSYVGRQRGVPALRLVRVRNNR